MMNKETKQIVASEPSVSYDSPSVRVVNVKIQHSILTVSNNEYNTDPGEMGEENAF